MNQVALSDRLRGNTPLRVDELLLIASALGVPAAMLLGDEAVSA